VRRHSGRQSLRRRIIALAAAYALALSSLLASFGAAQAEADAVVNPGSFLCHGAALGGAGIPSDQGNGRICIDCCCVGCLMPMVALPPPPLNVTPPSRAISIRILPGPVAGLIGVRAAKSHRSRAPPYVA
jgi:hypothetical protein